MEKWEYRTMFLCADIENPGARECIQEVRPSWQDPPKYTPETMMPQLNKIGERGWELVHMEPVSIDKDGRIQFASEYGLSTRCYFCVFKRRKEE